ncbi:response regulator [Roseibium sp. CAU 1637]|uniref:Response regulator n=1 Tax=Roseibium limicola TaxID=2816037 RepID=A0A939EQ92_9HYPH|nr:response regulator [Roseibium limicola]MBO0346350.1 response regulator [Roseibium limicola]
MPPKALYVDDEQDICEIAKMCLEMNGDFETRYVCSGAEALTVAKEWRPDVILLDVMMPGMDGLTTCSRLKGMPETTSVPVIFITAKALDTELADLNFHDVLGVLAKPFQAMTLASDVKKLMDSER